MTTKSVYIVQLHYRDGSRGQWITEDATEYRTMLDKLKAFFGKKQNLEFGTLDDLSKPFGMVRMDELLSFEGRTVVQPQGNALLGAATAEVARKEKADAEQGNGKLEGTAGTGGGLPSPDTGPSTKTGFNPPPPAQGAKTTETAKAAGQR